MSDIGTTTIPKVAGWPLIGSARELSANPATFVMQAGQANGGLAEVRSYRRMFVAVTDPDLVRQILVTRHQKYRRSHAFGRPLLGESLLTSDGADWQKRRRQVGSAFRFEMLDRLMPLIREETDLALGRWAELARAGRPLALEDEVRRLVILGLTRAMLSAMPANERNDLAESVLAGLRLTQRRNGDVLRFPRAFPTPANRRLAHGIRDVDGHLRPSIISRRRPAAASERRDLLDALLAVKDPEGGDTLGDRQVMAELKGFLAAGIDTTAAVLTGVIERLAGHSEIATAWHSEVDREIGRRFPERADLSRLTRLTQIVNETMRLRPPVPTLSRECVETDDLGGHVIPRGTRLLLSILAVHHDERYWPQPEEFRPGRFAREWPRHAFLPFGTGHHACVANNYALTQILMTLAMIGQRFRLAITPSTADAARNGKRATMSDEMLLRITPRA